MEEQIRKLKSKSVISIILALLALTWQFLNFITIKEYIPMDNFTSFEVIIIYSSSIFLLILFLALISLTFTSFRISMKFNSDKRKGVKQKAIENTNEITKTK